MDDYKGLEVVDIHHNVEANITIRKQIIEELGRLCLIFYYKACAPFLTNTKYFEHIRSSRVLRYAIELIESFEEGVIIQDAAIAYVKARNARKAAKEALQQWCEENKFEDGDYPCVNYYKGQACFQQNLPTADYCDLCNTRQPLYHTYRQAAAKQQDALRTLDNLVNKTTIREIQ